MRTPGRLVTSVPKWSTCTTSPTRSPPARARWGRGRRTGAGISTPRPPKPRPRAGLRDGEVSRAGGEPCGRPCQDVRAGGYVAGRDLVGDIHQRGVRGAAEEGALHFAYVRVGGAVVGEEGDDRRHTRARSQRLPLQKSAHAAPRATAAPPDAH